jgi:hypothetical protein
MAPNTAAIAIGIKSELKDVQNGSGGRKHTLEKPSQSRQGGIETQGHQQQKADREAPGRRRTGAL